MADKLFSVNRGAGTPATLRGQFEEHIYFSDDKVGVIIFSDTLANITATVANYYVSKGYHVGFLTDTSDAAHAYACPCNQFRAYLRALGTPIDNLQKMISNTGSILATAAGLGLTGGLQNCGLHWFIVVERNLQISSQAGLGGYIPKEIGNLKNAFTHSSSTINLTGNGLVGSIPKEIGNLVNLVKLGFGNNNITGTIPKEIGNLIKLNNLTCNNNLDLEGSLPDEFWNLIKMAYLQLDHTKIGGVLPTEMGGMTKLATLYLNDCKFIDYEAGGFSVGQTVLVTVWLHNNGTLANPFPVASINQICIDLLASVVAAERTGVLNLSGTYMPQPTGAGLTAAQSLHTDHGWTVTLHDGAL